MAIAVVAAVAGTLAVPASASASLPSCGGLSKYDVLLADKQPPFQGTTQFPTTATGVNNFQCVLGPGSQGWGVVGLQLALNSCSHAGLTVDGIYGPATEAAVKWMQGSVGITTDGVYGPETMGNAIQWPVRNDDGDLKMCVSGRNKELVVKFEP